jgi:hypothetical protein
MYGHDFREEVAKLSLEAGKLSMYKSVFYPAIKMIQRGTVHLENTQEDCASSHMI